MTELEYDEKGLIPVIVQDFRTNEVLMMAWSNAEAVELMKTTGYTHFWSRSRQEIWRKGEESGHVQRIVSMQADCDSDTLLVRVEQTGVACHTGAPSCFFRTIYGSTDGTAAVLPDLLRVIEDRKTNPSDESYTCKLFEDETKMCKKVVEEAGEFALSVKNRRIADDKGEEETSELADLIYHVLVVAVKEELPMDKVYEKLTERRQ
jgi:phosphoribosyl-AMP cyclohydrolase / phosphoribosyl-ATP pyrophosphohydrolase